MSTSTPLEVSAQALVAEYCPPLEASVVLTILHDSPNDLAAVRVILDILKPAATEELNQAEQLARWDAEEAWEQQRSSHAESISADEELFSGSTSLSTASTPEDLSLGDLSLTDAVDDAGKIAFLRSVVPNVEEYTIKQKLAKCGGNENKALDELLNLNFFESGEHEDADLSIPRGIDGFVELGIRSKKKGKKKKRGNQLETLDSEMQSKMQITNTAAPLSVWEQKDQDLEFLTSAFGLPKKTAASLLASNKNLLGSIHSVIDGHFGSEKPIYKNDQKVLADFQQKHVSLNPEEVKRVFCACNGRLDAVEQVLGIFEYELQKSIQEKIDVGLTKTKSKPAALKLTSANFISHGQISPQNDGQQAPRKSTVQAVVIGRDISSNPIAASSSPSVSLSAPIKDPSAATYAAAASSHREYRNELYEKARVAHKQANVKSQFGAVAAYYAEEGRKLDAKFRKYDEMSARAKVDENSSDQYGRPLKNRRDLHHVSVSHGVAIAREDVRQWWADAQRQPGRAVEPFTIVTGAGLHSKDNQPRLGPAVSRMLLKEGYRIEVRRAEVRVLGVMKK